MNTKNNINFSILKETGRIFLDTPKAFFGKQSAIKQLMLSSALASGIQIANAGLTFNYDDILALENVGKALRAVGAFYFANFAVRNLCFQYINDKSDLTETATKIYEHLSKNLYSITGFNKYDKDSNLESFKKNHAATNGVTVFMSYIMGSCAFMLDPSIFPSTKPKSTDFFKKRLESVPHPESDSGKLFNNGIKLYFATIGKMFDDIEAKHGPENRRFATASLRAISRLITPGPLPLKIVSGWGVLTEMTNAFFAANNEKLLNTYTGKGTPDKNIFIKTIELINNQTKENMIQKWR
jgi:hypothetical protein